MENTKKEIREDKMQKRVTELDQGYHLVLAPAGCGKTHILAERVKRALQRGLKPEDMLCLTFTNRASRGMKERIAESLGTDVSELFVGNIHRFCSKFLYENNIVSQTGSILDEDDTLSILTSISNYITEDREKADVSLLEFKEQKKLTAVIQMQHLMRQYRLGHPKNVFLVNESDYIDADRSERFFSPIIFREACKAAGLPVSLDSILAIYDDSVIEKRTIEMPARFEPLRALMATAREYELYKERENVLDFDDLLIETFDYTLRNEDKLHKYSWIQIDEVQDLNPLQFSIVDAFTAKENVTVWLGDEQQAIFSFIGAKLNTLEALKLRVGSNIHHLNRNYRSPKYLLDVFNDYASEQLDTPPEFLPQTDMEEKPEGNDLLLYYALDSEKALDSAAGIARSYTEGSTAILVTRNAEAEKIAKSLKGIPHLKLSGTDLFSRYQTKVIASHLNIVSNDTNHMAWSRLMGILKILPSHSKARELVSIMKRNGMLPSDLFLYPGSSYLLEFMKAMEEKSVVIFDTETTGLDIYEDDIVQIAATRYEKGEPKDTLNIFLETDREIPEKLGELVNPLIAEYARHPHLNRKEGLQRFIDFANGSVLMGHNVGYDYQILIQNCRREGVDEDMEAKFREVYDTLKLARMIRPGMTSYKLKDLLRVFELEGENSHLADADIAATHSLAMYCHARGHEKKEKIQQIIESSGEVAEKLEEIYAPLYRSTVARLYERRHGKEPAMVEEMQRAHSHFVEAGSIKAMPKLNQICRFLTADVIDAEKTPSLYEQLGRHLMEFNTFREADICSSSIVDERYIISTVHKAKGLEFDNVIVFGCVDDVYPFFSSKFDMEARKEDARKLYVAMTRAKKRLCLLAYNEKKVISKQWKDTFNIPCSLSPFLSNVVNKHPFNTFNER